MVTQGDSTRSLQPAQFAERGIRIDAGAVTIGTELKRKGIAADETRISDGHRHRPTEHEFGLRSATCFFAARARTRGT